MSYESAARNLTPVARATWSTLAPVTVASTAYGQQTMNVSLKSLVKFFLIAIALSTFLTRIFLLIRLQNYHQNAVVSDYLLAGTPHWRVFQSRFLGPLAQSAIEWGMGLFGHLNSPTAAYDVYAFLSLTGVIICYGLISLCIFSKLSEQIAYFSSILLCYIFMQDRNWFYPWDPLEIICFSVLYILIVKRRPLFEYWILFACALANKETSMFIGLWLLVDSVTGPDKIATWRDVGRLRLTPSRALSGVAMIASTFLIIDILRNAFYKSNYDLQHLGKSVHDSAGNPFVLLNNIHTVTNGLFFGNIIYFPVLEFVFILSSLYIYKMIYFRNYSIFDLKLLVFGGGLLLIFILFALIDEIRALNYTIPFVFHAAMIARTGDSPSKIQPASFD